MHCKSIFGYIFKEPFFFKLKITRGYWDSPKKSRTYCLLLYFQNESHAVNAKCDYILV